MSKSSAFALMLALAAGGPALAQTAADVQAVAKVVRTPILGVQLAEAKTIDHVRGASVTFTPNQHTGRHQHPIPVIGYVVSGAVAFQVEGQPARTLHAGEAFYEPANTTIAVFDNASASDPATFIGFYLMGAGETEVVRAAP